jgi:hypothetical protein
LIHFRNDGHYQYMVVFYRLLEKYPDAKAAIPVATRGEFDDLLGLEEKLVNDMQKSSLTVEIADADHAVDQAIAGIRGAIEAFKHHYDPAFVEAARQLADRFDAFGRIARKTYEEEAADTSLLVGDLERPPYRALAKLLGLDGWVEQLDHRVQDFARLLDERVQERVLKPRGRLKDVRREIDVVYHEMVNRLEAANTMDDTGLKYATCITELNVEIAYFNAHAHQHAARDISAGDDCVIEPIELQKYSGKAVTPIPRAYYRGGEGKPTVELVFARDFSLTYKNNVEVGMAEVTLSGKGAYRGQRSTTFNIAR